MSRNAKGRALQAANTEQMTAEGKHGRKILGPVALAALVSLVPLVLLTIVAIRLATDAVKDEVRARVSATATSRADAVETELGSLTGLVESYATRPSLVTAAARPRRAASREAIRFQLAELSVARPGIDVVFLADLNGILLDIVPPTESIVGRDFSFRDWYRGLAERGDTYVSELYATQAAGGGRVVAAATYVRRTPSSDPVAILVAGYGLDHIQSFVDRFQSAQGLRVTVTDQRGVVVAAPGGVPRRLVSIRDDPRIAAALAGQRGVVDHAGPDRDELSAYAPVRGIGWTVTASVPREVAFDSVATLRATVLGISGALALILIVGLVMVARSLRARLEADRQVAEARDELESQNVELEQQTAELAGEKHRVDTLFAFGQQLASLTELEELATVVLREAGDAARADAGVLYARDGEEGDDPVLLATRGLDRDRLPAAVSPGAGPAGRALVEARPILGSYGDAGIEVAVLGSAAVVRHELHLPLLQADRCIGVMGLARLADEPFTQEDVETLEHLAGQAAVSLANVVSFRAARRAASVNSAVIDATPDAIQLVDLDGYPLVENAAMRDLRADGTRHESIYAAIDDLAERAVDSESLREAMEACARDPEHAASLTVESAETGRAFHLYTAPVREDGEPIARIFVFRDVTAEREGERLKTELLATVSHELRTPLASILGFSELMAARDIDEDSRRRFVGTIHREARRLTDLINDFLDLQRIEERRFTLDLQRFDLVQLLEEQAEVFAGQSRDHEVQVDGPGEQVELLGDRDRVAQVLANLISNAIKYSPAGGEVRIRAERRDARAHVAVTDHGLGIPSDQQARIFSKFFRVDSSDTREIGGTGLGLALSREIVEAHGGQIGFASVEGEGSTFWFELPAGPVERQQGRRVLVVEDDPAASELLRESLSGNGLVVEVVATGEEALERIAEAPPAVVCLDIALGGDLDGWDVLERLKASEATEQIPVVVCSSGSGRDRAAGLGAADFVPKPFSPAHLRAVVARALPEARGSVLVVDDEADVRRLVIDALSGDGLEFSEAADGVEALDAVAARRPDLIVLDLMMPRLDGFGVLERLQGTRATRTIPVVVLTARQLSADERRLLQQRMVSLLEKASYSGDELRRLVENAIGA